jgi:hypothetical protein
MDVREHPDLSASAGRLAANRVLVDGGQDLVRRALQVGIDRAFVALRRRRAEAEVNGAQPVEHPGGHTAQHLAHVFRARRVVDVRPLVGDEDGDQLGVGRRQG